MPVLQISISGHSNIVVVTVQVKIDNSITEGEEKRKIVASSCIGPGLSSESEIRHHCADASRVTRTLTLVHGLKNVMPRPPETLWWKRTVTRRPLDPL